MTTELNAIPAHPGSRVEVIEGHVVSMPPAEVGHAAVVTSLAEQLAEELPDFVHLVQSPRWHLVSLKAGAPSTTLVPDLAAVRWDRERKSDGMPLIVAEVVSQDDFARLPNGKTHLEWRRRMYSASGVTHYLEVMEGPDETMIVTRFEARHGGLEAVAMATEDEILRSNRPFPYGIHPALLGPFKLDLGPTELRHEAFEQQREERLQVTV